MNADQRSADWLYTKRGIQGELVRMSVDGEIAPEYLRRVDAHATRSAHCVSLARRDGEQTQRSCLAEAQVV